MEKRDGLNPVGTDGAWPRWARRLTTAALVFHMSAVLVGALAAVPSSPLERSLGYLFRHYYELIDQGYAYRFYAPAPPPTPVVEARLHFADGRSDRTIRLPDRAIWLRLRYQRQLALANHVFVEYSAGREAEAGSRVAVTSHWAPSYARHLGSVYGCSSVTLYVKHHMIPDPDRVRAARLEQNAAAFDIDADEFYSVPERIGDYPCDAS
jgi:hypothetical protein